MTAPISNGPTTHGYTTMRDATVAPLSDAYDHAGSTRTQITRHEPIWPTSETKFALLEPRGAASGTKFALHEPYGPVSGTKFALLAQNGPV